MVRSIGILVVLFLLGTAASGQSGRRSAPTPTPTPRSESAENYSETKPSKRPPRVYSVQPTTTTTASTADAVSVSDSEGTLKVDTSLVTVPVSVFDRNGLYIPNLQQSDFKIFEDGVEQEIAYFATSDKPFSVVLLLDTSPSTQYRIEEIRAGAKAFVEQLKTNDRVMVVEFDSSIKVRCEFTNDRASIFRGIDKADFGNGTSIYEAVDRTLKRFLQGIEGRKAVVLFTDGVDTTSRKATFDSTLSYAEELDAMIFPIYFNTYNENRRAAGTTPTGGGGLLDIFLGGPTTTVGRGLTAAEYAVGKKYVEDLADYTGGRVFIPESTPGGLTRAFEGIAEELRRQYSIGYVPEADSKTGQRKQIKVRVGRPNLLVRSRDSYVVGSSK